MKFYGIVKEQLAYWFRVDSNILKLTPNSSTSYSATRTVELPNADADDELAGLTASQVLENKTIESNSKLADESDNTITIEWDLSGATTGKTLTLSSSQSDDRTITIPNATDTLVGRATTDTLTNKSIDSDNNTITNITNTDIKSAAAIARSKLADGTANYVIINDGTGTLSEEQYLDKTRGGTGITSTATYPASGTVSTRDATENLTNKTLIDPTIESAAGTARQATLDISGATDNKSLTLTSSHSDNRTITLPDATDTLVGLTTTDNLQNKQLYDDSCYVVDSDDTSRKLAFDLQDITASNTRTFRVPDADDTLAGIAATQTLTNKSIDSDNNTITNITNTDIKAAADIARSKVASGTADYVMINDGSGDISEEQYLDKTRGGTGITSTATYPASGVVTTRTSTDTGADRLQNKDLSDDNCHIVDAGDTSRKLAFDLQDITTSNTRTFRVPDQNDTLAGIAATQTLTNKAITSPDIDGGTIDDATVGGSTPASGTFTDVTIDGASDNGDAYQEFTHQSANAATPGSGSDNVRLFAKSKRLYTTVDDGSGTGIVTEVGSGASGGTINYIDDSKAESNSTGDWAEYDDGASDEPVDGTGGTASNLTLSAQNTTVLRGDYSYQITKDAADAQGEGFSYAFAIDSADESKRLKISFDWRTDSTYSSDDMGLYIYDVDNSNLIYPSLINLPCTSGSTTKIETYYNATDSSNYRLILHVQTTAASAYDVYFDNIEVGPEAVIQGVPFEGGTEITDSILNITAASVEDEGGYYWRVGNRMIVQYGCEFSDTYTAGAINVSIPDGLSVDTTVLFTGWTGVEMDLQAVGNWMARDTSDNEEYSGGMRYDISGNIIRMIGFNPDINTPFTIANSDGFSFRFEVPIAEWAGSSVGLANSRVEYASNSDYSDADDTTSFQYGPSGNLIPNKSAGTSVTKRIRFLTPIQSTDNIIVQTNRGGDKGWEDSSMQFPHVWQGTSRYGIAFYRVSSSNTDMDVEFRANGATPSGVNYSDNGADWSIYYNGGTLWRVVKSANPLSVGMPQTIKWQTKLLASSTSANGEITDLTFNNLTVGKTYRASIQGLLRAGTDTTLNIKIVNDSKDYGAIRINLANSEFICADTSTIFVATASTVTFEITSGASNAEVVGDSTKQVTFSTLEELPYHIETTDWT